MVTRCDLSASYDLIACAECYSKVIIIFIYYHVSIGYDQFFNAYDY